MGCQCFINVSRLAIAVDICCNTSQDVGSKFVNFESENKICPYQMCRQNLSKLNVNVNWSILNFKT